MLKDTSVVKALLKEGFFIKYEMLFKLVLENKEGITFSMDENSHEEVVSNFTKYLEIGDVSFISISYENYSQLLNNFEKDLKFIKDVTNR